MLPFKHVAFATTVCYHINCKKSIMGFKMELRKLGIIWLSALLLFSQTCILSSFAIEEKGNKKTKQQEINKVEYINLDFWNNYGDDNLKYYILRAVEGNYDLKMAAENSEIYRQYVSMQRSAEFPTIGAGFSPNYLKMPKTTDYDWVYALPLYVNYEADIFLKNHDKTKISKKNYEMQLLGEKASYISVASMVGTVYFNILKIDSILELQEEIVNLRKEIYDLMTLSHKEGIISLQDVIRAEQSYIKGNTDFINLKKQRLQLINNLAVLIGANPNDTSDFKYSALNNIEYKGLIPESLNSDIITNRPDYMKAEKNVEKAGLDIKVAKKEFLPTINITGLSLFNATKLSSLLTTKNAVIGVGGALFGDLFAGGRKFANLKVKKAEYKKALQLYEKTNLTAIQEVNDALVSIKHDSEKYNENKKQNTLEEKDYNLKDLRYKEGVISRLELIQAKENLLTVKKLVLSDKADCLIDYIGLYKATGAKI